MLCANIKKRFFLHEPSIQLSIRNICLFKIEQKTPHPPGFGLYPFLIVVTAAVFFVWIFVLQVTLASANCKHIFDQL